MKKIILYLSLAAAMISCAKELTPVSEEAPKGVPMTFNVTVTGTKAEKSDWAAGDVVYVFFNGLETKYLSLTYDGTKWASASEGGTLVDSDFSALSDKTLTAVHFPVAVDVSFAGSRFSFTKDGDPVYNYYLVQTGKEYEVDGTTVNATLEMGKPNGVAQFHVAGIQDDAADYFFSSSEIVPVTCAAVEIGGVIIERTQNAGGYLRGVADADGVVFGGRLAHPGRAAEYQFLLTGPDKIYKLERSKKTLSAGVRYNFPAPGEDGWEVAVDLDGKSYDFLHLAYYTFNTIEESRTYVDDDGITKSFLQKMTCAEIDDSVVWWTKANPSYFTDASGDFGRISFRHALAEYEMHPINLAELAFNVVDEEDKFLTDAQIEAAGLTVKFDYADPNLAEMDLPEQSQGDDYYRYGDLWLENNVFYIRTNEKKFIPMVGKLFVSDDEGNQYELPTRFSRPKASVKCPDLVLDYSSYVVANWTPFKEPVASGFTIVLDEHKIYREPLFQGLELKDNRPNGVSYYVIKDGKWIEGNVDEFDALAGTYTTGGNGYIKGILSRDAYSLSLNYGYDYAGVPTDLRGLLSVQYSDDGVTFVDEQNAYGTLTPYLVFDYRSQIQFSGTATIVVEVILESPWQEPLTAEYSITIEGYHD